MRSPLVLFVLLFVFLPLYVLGDEPRITNHFISSNKQFELRLADDSRWDLIEKSSSRVVYRIDGNLGPRAKLWAMSAFVSDDGRYVVAIDDYSEQDFAANPEVLYFLNDGRPFRSYKLTDLVDTKFVEASVSHFRWLIHPKAIALTERSISFATYELNQFAFNIETGDIERKEKDKLLADGSIYVFGTVRSINKDEFEIKVRCSIYGPTKRGAVLKFNSKTYGWEGSGFDESLVLNKGNLVERVGIYFNNCEDPIK